MRAKLPFSSFHFSQAYAKCTGQKFQSVENEENWKSKLMVKAVAWNVSTGSFLVVVYFDKIPIIFLVWQYLNTQKM